MRHFKLDTRQRLFLSIGSLSAVAVLAVITSPPAAPVVYKRYISRPLPDGTRYTFLYPVNLDDTFVYPRLPKNGVQSVAISKPFTFVGNILPKGLGRSLSNTDESVGVEVTDPVKDFFPGGGPMPITHTNRTEEWGSRGGNFDHVVRLNDSRLGLRFTLVHDAGSALQVRKDPYVWAEFERTDSTILNSFRILPPGAAVPKP